MKEKSEIHEKIEKGYTANSTFVAAQGGVIIPYNRVTILRRYALHYTATNALFTVFN